MYSSFIALACMAVLTNGRTIHRLVARNDSRPVWTPFLVSSSTSGGVAQFAADDELDHGECMVTLPIAKPTSFDPQPCDPKTWQFRFTNWTSQYVFMYNLEHAVTFPHGNVYVKVATDNYTHSGLANRTRETAFDFAHEVPAIGAPAPEGWVGDPVAPTAPQGPGDVGVIPTATSNDVALPKSVIQVSPTSSGTVLSSSSGIASSTSSGAGLSTSSEIVSSTSSGAISSTSSGVISPTSSGVKSSTSSGLVSPTPKI